MQTSLLDKDYETLLLDKDYETFAALLDSLVHYSLDHDLDLILVGLGAKLSALDFYGAADCNAQAIKHCANLLNLLE